MPSQNSLGSQVSNSCRIFRAELVATKNLNWLLANDVHTLLLAGITRCLSKPFRNIQVLGELTDNRLSVLPCYPWLVVTTPLFFSRPIESLYTA